MLEQSNPTAVSANPVRPPLVTRIQLPRLKPSRYNIFSEQEDAVWAFNSWSTALSKLDRRQYQVVQKFLGGATNAETQEERQIFDGLVRGNFLVNPEVDELEMLKVKNRLSRFNKRGLGLVIAPTLRCNFSCEYCYVDLNANRMSTETREKVKRFFAQNMDRKASAMIVWTGGDPSLGMDVVHELSQSFIETCRAKESTYAAVMITNGYLLDEVMLRKILESRIHALQITLDGSREEHNQRRYLPGKKPTYDRILDNVANACERVRINLRINIDRHNQHSIEDIFKDLAARGIAKKVACYFANVDAVNEQASRYEGRTLSHEEFARLQPSLNDMARSYGVLQAESDLTLARGEFCGANSNNYYVIDSNAQLLKCYNDFGTADKNGVGYISDEGKVVINKHHNLVRWMGWDPFEIPECRDCKVLPLCMGGCSYSKIRNKEDGELGCITLKYSVEEVVSQYGRRMSEGKQAQAVAGCGTGGCTTA